MCEWITQLGWFFQMNQSESNRNLRTKLDKSSHYYVCVYIGICCQILIESIIKQNTNHAVIHPNRLRHYAFDWSVE